MLLVDLSQCAVTNTGFKEASRQLRPCWCCVAIAEPEGAVPACRRMTLLQADSVWEQYLEHTERLLTMRQYAVAVMGLMETSLQLQNLHHPWLALLRRPAANE